LRSAERRPIERALGWLLAGRESSADAEEEALRVLDATLELVNARVPLPETETPESAARASVALVERLRDAGIGAVPALALDEGAPLGPQVSEYRRRLIDALRERPDAKRISGRAADLARIAEETRERLEASVAAGIRRFLRARDERLRHLEYDLEAALSQALTLQSEPIPPQTR
ncbi:MAG: hypothetical protein ACREQY_22920, partial [Candidatus Binatia bacterium]